MLKAIGAGLRQWGRSLDKIGVAMQGNAAYVETCECSSVPPVARRRRRQPPRPCAPSSAPEHPPPKSGRVPLDDAAGRNCAPMRSQMGRYCAP